MNRAAANQRIEALLKEAEDHNQYGGDETSDGRLIPGIVDWKKLRSDIASIVMQIDP